MNEETSQEIASDIADTIASAPEPTEKIKFANLGEKTEKIIDIKPVPIAANQEKKVFKIDPTPGKTDKEGFLFDKRLHETNKDGTPRIQGRWIKQKNGWFKGYQEILGDMEQSARAVPIAEKEPPSIKVDVQLDEEDYIQGKPGETQSTGEAARVSSEKAKAMARSLGVFFTDSFIGAGFAKFGDEWLPKEIPGANLTERENIINLWAENLEDSENIDSLPDSTPLFLAHFAYCSDRFAKGGKFTNWMRSKFSNFFRAREIKAKPEQEKV